MSKTILVVPDAYNNIRVTSALETIVDNLDKIPVESLEEFVKGHDLINWNKKK